MRKLIAVFCITAVLLGLTACAANNKTVKIYNVSPIEIVPNDDKTEGQFEFVAQNSNVALYAVLKGTAAGSFFISNLKDGSRIYSNPQNINRGEDTAVKPELYAQFSATVLNTVVESAKTVNSYTASGNGKNISVKTVKDGFNTTYFLKPYNMYITLRILLISDGISVEMSLNDICSNGDYNLVSLDLLPYFGAADSRSKGALLVPDGSGALIYHNNGKNTARRYSQKVFGSDAAFEGDIKVTDTENIHLPVFGSYNSDMAYIGIIEDGASSATVNASVSANGFNTIYPEFEIAGSDDISVGETASGITESASAYAFDMPLTDTCKVSYSVLNAGSDYNEMAKVCRNRFVKKASGESGGTDIFLEIYGAVRKQESLYGIPYKTNKVLTDTAFAADIAKSFSNDKVSLTYFNADKAVLSQKMQSRLRLLGALGNKKDFKALSDLLDGRLYIQYDPLSAVKSGYGYSKYKDTAKRINRSNVILKTYDPVTNKGSVTKLPSLLPDNNYLNESARGFIASAEDSGLSVAFTTLGSELYSDFTRGSYSSRGDMLKTVSEILANSENPQVYSANSYMLSGNVSSIPDAPLENSEFDIEDQQIPFYSMVISGAYPYSGDSINFKTDERYWFLKTAESGAYLKFTFAGNGISNISGTEWNYLYSADYSSWKDRAKSLQEELKQIYEELGSTQISKHRILSDDVRLTEYISGNALIVNYGEKDAETPYGRVKSEDYIIVPGEDVL